MRNKIELMKESLCDLLCTVQNVAVLWVFSMIYVTLYNNSNHNFSHSYLKHFKIEIADCDVLWTLKNNTVNVEK